jgi:hypothetical protein
MRKDSHPGLDNDLIIINLSALRNSNDQCAFAPGFYISLSHNRVQSTFARRGSFMVEIYRVSQAIAQLMWDAQG